MMHCLYYDPLWLNVRSTNHRGSLSIFLSVKMNGEYIVLFCGRSATMTMINIFISGSHDRYSQLLCVSLGNTSNHSLLCFGNQSFFLKLVLPSTSVELNVHTPYVITTENGGDGESASIIP